ncbi:uncharacterized protein LOC120164368 [Hibiscus syriacus]|uniref:uncharacterized protein LOC120164368 n=1 Tax=Hibiscus syriacus TaxID=106335 RepID=UPI001920B795|nr:uncharacterized protein LOC120164368 [Hibiscus syriacus]
MANAPVKSQPLHNFNFPFLKWGTHGGGSSSNTNADNLRSPESYSDHDRLRPTRVGSRTTRVYRLSFPPPPRTIKQQPREEEEQQHKQEEESLKPRGNEAEEDDDDEKTVQRPWNLRSRKLVVETSAAEKMSKTAAPKSMRLRGLTENGGVAVKKEKRKFWIALSKEEIEEDIFVITGSRPARRPKKRSKNIQKQLDNVFPGLWLVGTTADAYRIVDVPVKASLH